MKAFVIPRRRPLTSRSLEPLYQCLIQSRSTTLALDAPSAFVLVQQTFWKWFPGMAVRPDRLPLLPVQKTVWAASGVKRLVRQISSVSGFIWAQKQPAAWGWLTRLQTSDFGFAILDWSTSVFCSESQIQNFVAIGGAGWLLFFSCQCKFQGQVSGAKSSQNRWASLDGEYVQTGG